MRGVGLSHPKVPLVTVCPSADGCAGKKRTKGGKESDVNVIHERFGAIGRTEVLAGSCDVFALFSCAVLTVSLLLSCALGCSNRVRFHVELGQRRFDVRCGWKYARVVFLRVLTFWSRWMRCVLSVRRTRSIVSNQVKKNWSDEVFSVLISFSGVGFSCNARALKLAVAMACRGQLDGCIGGNLEPTAVTPVGVVLSMVL